MDNSPTALFDTYEQDFKQIVQSISQKLEGDVRDERGGEFASPHAQSEVAEENADEKTEDSSLSARVPEH